jgi:hypothetical protein
MRLRRDQLSQGTIRRLELLSGDPQKLLERNSRARSYCREPAIGQCCAEVTTSSRDTCTAPLACAGCEQRSGATCKLLGRVPQRRRTYPKPSVRLESATIRAADTTEADAGGARLLPLLADTRDEVDGGAIWLHDDLWGYVD